MVLVGAKPVQAGNYFGDVDLQTPMWMTLPRWCPTHTLDGGTTPQNSTLIIATFDQYIHTGHIRNSVCFTWKQDV